MTGVAVIVTALPEQKEVDGVEIEMLTGRFGVTVIIAWLLIAGLPAAHVSDEVSMQVMISLLFGMYKKVGLLVPEIIPFTFHKKAGVTPPFTAVAVYVTAVPEQTGFDDAVTETATGKLGSTFIMIVLLVAGLPIAQVSEEVRTQLTMSLSVGI